MSKGDELQFSDVMDLVVGAKGREAEANGDPDGGIWSAGQVRRGERGVVQGGWSGGWQAGEGLVWRLVSCVLLPARVPSWRAWRAWRAWRGAWCMVRGDGAAWCEAGNTCSFAGATWATLTLTPLLRCQRLSLDDVRLRRCDLSVPTLACSCRARRISHTAPHLSHGAASLAPHASRAARLSRLRARRRWWDWWRTCPRWRPS